MLSKPRKDLRERVISMVPTWDRETVYSVLKDFNNSPLEEMDDKTKLPLMYAFDYNMWHVVEWFFDDKAHPNYSIKKIGVYLAYLAEKADDGKDSKDINVNKSRETFDLLIKKIWAQDKNIAKKMSDFTEIMKSKKSYNIFKAIIESMKQQVHLNNTEIIIPFLNNFLIDAVDNDNREVIKLILAVCEEQNASYKWKQKLIELPTNALLVNHAIKNGRLFLAKFLIEQGFPCNQSSNSVEHPIVLILKQCKDKQILIATALNLLRSIQGKHNKLKLELSWLELAHACPKPRADLINFLLSDAFDKSEISQLDMIRVFKSVNEFVNYHIRQNIPLSIYPKYVLGNNFVTAALREKKVEPAVLHAVLANGNFFTWEDVELAFKTKQPDVIKLVLDFVPTLFRSNGNSFSSLVKKVKEIWRYSSIIERLISNGLPLHQTYCGDYPLTHILRNYREAYFDRKKVEEFFASMDFQKTSVNLIDFEIIISANDQHLLKCLLNRFDKAKELVSQEKSLLIQAVELGNEKMVALLLACNCAIGQERGGITNLRLIKVTALEKAVTRGDLTIFKMLCIAACNTLNQDQVTYLLDILGRKINTTAKLRIQNFLQAMLMSSHINNLHDNDKFEYAVIIKLINRSANVMSKFSVEIQQKVSQFDYANYLKNIYDAELVVADAKKEVTEPSAPVLPQSQNNGVVCHQQAKQSILHQELKQVPVLAIPSAPAATPKNAEGQPNNFPSEGVLQHPTSVEQMLAAQNGIGLAQLHADSDADSDNEHEEGRQQFKLEPDIEGVPSEHKVVPPSYSQFSCVQFQPRGRNVDAEADQRFTRQLKEMLDSGYFNGEDSGALQESIRRFWEKKSKQLTEGVRSNTESQSLMSGLPKII